MDTIAELQMAIKKYHASWQTFLGTTNLQLADPLPTAVGWKVGDRTAFDACLSQLLDSSSQAHVGRVNDRFIASIVLQQPLEWDVRVVKLMQRRPGSADPPGLDHIDFYLPDLKVVLEQCRGAGLAIEQESNDAHSWLSLRFDGLEAKFVDHTVWILASKNYKPLKPCFCKAGVI